MMQFALIGLGAGAAAALLFASVMSGSLLSVLFYIAPLPMMIAGLGWSHWSGLIGALTGALAVGALFGPVFFVGFLASAGLPAWWLSYLTMLARPAATGGNGGAPALEWYPPGRLVMWAAILAILVIVFAVPNFGSDAESFRAGIREALAQVLRVETAAPAGAPVNVPGVSNAQRLLDVLVIALPLAGAVLATITNVFNLWLAGRIVRFSGRLTRPWPKLEAMTFPRRMALALAAATLAIPLGGMLGIVSGVVLAAFLMAYGVLGFAVMHAITQGMNARGLVLGGVYAAVLVIGWPVLALCLLGLIETAIDLRARIARTRGIPPAHP